MVNFSGGKGDIKILNTLSEILTKKSIGSISFTSLVNPGFKDPYGVKEGSIEVKVGVKVKPKTEEKEQTEIDKTEIDKTEIDKTEKLEKTPKKTYKKIDDSIVSLEDIVSEKKLIKQGDSGDIVGLIQDNLKTIR